MKQFNVNKCVIYVEYLNDNIETSFKNPVKNYFFCLLLLLMTHNNKSDSVSANVIDLFDSKLQRFMLSICIEIRL